MGHNGGWFGNPFTPQPQYTSYAPEAISAGLQYEDQDEGEIFEEEADISIGQQQHVPLNVTSQFALGEHAEYESKQPRIPGLGGLIASSLTPFSSGLANNKSLNEEKANILRAKLMAMRANTPSRDKPAAADSRSNQSVDIPPTDIDNLLAQGKAAAESARAANTHARPHGLASLGTPIFDITPIVRLPTPTTLSAPADDAVDRAQDKNGVVASRIEFEEYQKLEEPSSRLRQEEDTAPAGCRNIEGVASGSPRLEVLEVSKAPAISQATVHATKNQSKKSDNIRSPAIRHDTPSRSSTDSTGIRRSRPPTGPRSNSFVNDSRRSSLQLETKAVESKGRVETTRPLPFPAPLEPLSPVQQADHERPLSTEGFQDLIEEWLVLSGFHDEDYRMRTLARYRRREALHSELAQLEHEMQAEAGFGFRLQSTKPKEEPKISRSTQMPPPSLPDKSRVVSITSHFASTAVASPIAAASPVDGLLERNKRPRSINGDCDRRQMPPEKYSRAEFNNDSAYYGGQDPQRRAEFVRAASPYGSYYNRTRDSRDGHALERRISYSDGREERTPRGRPFDPGNRYGDRPYEYQHSTSSHHGGYQQRGSFNLNSGGRSRGRGK